MVFQISVDSESALIWQPEKSLLITDLPETLFFGIKNWSIALIELHLNQSIVNVPSCDFEIHEKNDLKKFKIPDSNFTDMDDLLNYISRDGIFLRRFGSIITAQFRNIDNKLILPKILQKILGFDDIVSHGDSNIRPWNLWALYPTIHIKWEIAEKQILNNKYVNTVKTFSSQYKNTEYGKSICFKEEIPLFLKIDIMELTRIQIQLVNSSGIGVQLLPSSCFQASFMFKN